MMNRGRPPHDDGQRQTASRWCTEADRLTMVCRGRPPHDDGQRQTASRWCIEADSLMMVARGRPPHDGGQSDITQIFKQICTFAEVIYC